MIGVFFFRGIKMDNICLTEYDENASLYKKLEKVVHQKLTQAMKEAKIGVMQIAHRIKARDSVAEKIHRKSNKYATITDMTDVVGFRIICYFSDQVNYAAKVVEDLFEINRENSIDKRKMLAPTTFGYLSLHYVCTLLPEESLNEDLLRIPFEIQIRSVLQHTWAEIEHDLGYKSEFGVPYHIRREFSRIAGLLEIADESFINIRKNIVLYVEDVRNRIRHDTADELLLDVNTLREFTRHSAAWKDLIEKAILVSGAEQIETSSEEYLPQLKILGIKTLGDLKQAVFQEDEHIMTLVNDALEYFEMDEISSNTILYYLCQSLLIWGDYTDELTTAFFKLSDKNETRINNKMKRIKRMKEQYRKA